MEKYIFIGVASVALVLLITVIVLARQNKLLKFGRVKIKKGVRYTTDERVEKDNEMKKTYEVVLDSAWNLEHTYIYALAIDSDNFVDNMNLCAVNGGQALYTLK